MPWKSWAYLEKVPSADFQTYLQNQVVAVFTTPAQRDTQIPTPIEGMMCYVQSLKTVQVFNGVAWDSTPQATKIYTAAMGASVAGAGPTTLATIAVPAQAHAYQLEVVATWSPVLSVQGDYFTLSTRIGVTAVGGVTVRSPGANITIPMTVATSQLTPVAANVAQTVTAVAFRVSGTGNAIQDANTNTIQYLTARCYPN